jgi:hypothetical protein
MFWYDPSFLILIPSFFLTLWAQISVQSTFNTYSRKRSVLGETGAAFARRLLDSAGLYDVKVEFVNGFLSDHYDPSSKVLRLSKSTYGSLSVAALGVVAHEVGHAIQHAKNYQPLMIRNISVPLANMGSTLSWVIFFMGLIFSTPLLLKAGIFLFIFVVLFTLITLPVEFDASKRAIKMLPVVGMPSSEVDEAKKVLNAAAMTYVAAAFMAISQLLRMVLIAGAVDRRD